MRYSVCINEESMKYKPDPEKTVQIASRIARKRRGVTVEELIYEVVTNGKTFTPAVYRENRRIQSNFCSMQIYVLDFDDNTPYDIIRKKCDEFHLPILFSYHTFSSKPEYVKYRVIFAHMVPITDPKLARMILDMLKTMFPEADSQCFELARMFFGGKELIEKNPEAVFRVDELAEEFQIYLRRTAQQNYIRQIKKFAHAHGIEVLDKGILNIGTYHLGVGCCYYPEMEEIRGKPILYSIEFPQISSKVIIYQESDVKDRHQSDMCQEFHIWEKVKEEKLCSACRLCREYFEGVRLAHEDRFLIATNLIHIKGYRRKFLSVIREFYDSYDKWIWVWDYITAQQYSPGGCDRFCPYAGECDHDVNICTTVTGRRKIMRVVTEEKFISVEGSYNSMRESLIHAVKCPGKAIHLIKGQTGLGKSYAYKELMREMALQGNPIPLLIAVPTVRLKREIAECVKDVAVEALSVEDLPLPEDIRNRIAFLYARGLFKEAKREIVDYSETVTSVLEKQRFRNFLELSEILLKKEKHIITTHAMLLHMSENELSGYTIIIDEDILFTLARNTKEVSVEDVMRAMRLGLLDNSTAADIEMLLSLKEGAYVRAGNTYPLKYVRKKELDEKEIFGNINELMLAGAYHLNHGKILYYVPQRLPEQKLIIMSATLNEAVYRLFFRGRKIILYDTPRARYRGKVVQYTYHSMSRKTLSDLMKRCGGCIPFLQKLEGIVKEKVHYRISFKEFDSPFGSSLHFGNAAGIDKYKGKNGMIIGTPHLAEPCYKLLGCYLGLPVMGPQAMMKRLQIVHHGYDFYMMTYENESLRELQLYLIGSELEQCIGRSRLLREDATVYVFSNYPCEQAELVQDDYMEIQKKQMCC